MPRVVLVALALATVLSLLGTSQSYAARIAEGIPASWSRLLRIEALGWYAWVPLTPLVVTLGIRLGGGWVRGTLALAAAWLAAGLTVGLLHTMIEVPVARAFRWVPTSMPFGTMVLARYTETVTGSLMLVAVIGLGAYAVRQRQDRLARERREAALAAELAGARLQVLQMQLHPHFLFNALHTVSALIGEDVRAARTALARLGDLLRASLDRDGGQEVPLRDELGFVEKYVDIQRLRFRDRLVVDVEIAPDALDALVPALLLQPLVENAIRYTVEPRSECGEIAIRAARHGPDLLIEVRDGGPGPEGGALGRRSGLGLSTTRRRLEELYGERQRFELRSGDAGGTIARVVLPFHTEPFA